MAWQFRATVVSSNETRLEGDPPAPVQFDLSSIGMWRFEVDYFDSANPAVVLYHHIFVEPSEGFTVEAALEKIMAIGRRVRDTRALVSGFQGAVGAVFDLT